MVLRDRPRDYIKKKEGAMDIYIVRKCTIEVKDIPTSNEITHKVPVMTRESIHSYVVKASLTSEQREIIQKRLEAFYATDNGRENPRY